MVIYTYDVVVP